MGRHGSREQVACDYQNNKRDYKQPQAVVACARDENAEAHEQTNQRTNHAEVSELQDANGPHGALSQLQKEGYGKDSHDGNIAEGAQCDQESDQDTPCGVLVSDDAVLPLAGALGRT